MGHRHENGNYGRAARPAATIAGQRELAEIIAVRVVELLDREGRRPSGGFATAAEVAARLGVHKSWVYAHAEELGVIRLGDGGRPRLRFELEAVDRALRRRQEATHPQPRLHRDRRRKPNLPPGVKLLQPTRTE